MNTSFIINDCFKTGRRLVTEKCDGAERSLTTRAILSLTAEASGEYFILAYILLHVSRFKRSGKPN